MFVVVVVVVVVAVLRPVGVCSSHGSVVGAFGRVAFPLMLVASPRPPLAASQFYATGTPWGLLLSLSSSSLLFLLFLVLFSFLSLLLLASSASLSLSSSLLVLSLLLWLS